MPQLLVRDLDDETVTRLKEQARLHGRSLQAEVKQILERNCRPTLEEFRRRADEIRTQLSGRVHSSSADLLREDRDR